MIGWFSVVALQIAMNFASNNARECWRHEFAAKLVRYASPAVAIELPEGASGPTMEADGSDYRWVTSVGEVWIEFWKSPVDSGAKKIGTVVVGSADVVFYRWRDYSGAFRILGEWQRSTSIDRSVVVSVPFEDCEGASLARKIIESVRFINNPDLIRVESTRVDSDGWVATLINEIAVRRDVRLGDVATWDNGIVSKIDASGVLVRSYDWSSSSWKEKWIRSIDRDESKR